MGSMADANDPNSIDIGLNLMDDAGLAAIRNLTTQLAANAQMMQGMMATTPGANIQGQQAAAAAVQNPGATSVSASVGRREAQVTPPHTDTRSVRQRLRDIGQNGLRSEVVRYGRTEREQYLYRSGQGLDNDPHWQSLRGHVDSYEQDFPPGGPDSPGGLSSSASTGSSEPAWRQSLTANPKRWERSQERVQLPQFGELTIQDKLNLGSDVFARRAERLYQQSRDISGQYQGPIGPDGRGPALTEIDQARVDGLNARAEGPGYRAGLLQMASDQAGQLVAAKNEVQRFAGMFQGMSGRGTALGLDRGNALNIPFTDIGFANPASDAAKEGARQSLTSRRLSLQAGITGSRAREITDVVAGYGWSGDEAQGLAFDAMAPLVSRGFEPGDVGSLMDRSLRLGNSSVSEFVKTMGSLQDAAKTANLTLGETVEGMKEFEEFSTSRGATHQQAMQQGAALTNTNGLAPGVNARIMQGSLFQGMAAAQGFMPEQIGLMSANQTTKANYAALDLLEQTTQGYRSRATTDPETGEKMTGEESQYAAMAALSDGQYTVDEIRNLMRNRKANQTAARAGGRIRALDTNIKAREEFKEAQYRKYGTTEEAVMGQWGGINSPVEHRARRAKGIQEKVEKALREQGLTAGELDSDWQTVVGDLKSMAPGRAGDKNDKNRVRYFEQIRDLEKKNGRERTDAASKLLNDRRDAMSGANGDDKTDPDKVTLDLTDEAKQFFKEVRKKNSSQGKRDAQAGGKSTASQIIDGFGKGTAVSYLFGWDD